MNRTKFFGSVRASIFAGRMSTPQVQGCEAILDGWEARGGGRRQWLSYMLATAFHETAATMQPIAEYGKGKGHAYGKPGKDGGQIAYGRGFVQLTWDYNYEKMDAALHLNGRLIADYDLALAPAVAAEIMFVGMRDGLFTGKKLKDYLNGDGIDFRNARRIINGTDRADLIAGYAQKFDAAILAAVAVTAA